MANEYAVNQADLTAVADAIRAKGGTSGALAFPGGFVDAVGAIQVGGGESADIDQFIGNMFNSSYSGELRCLSAESLKSGNIRFEGTQVTSVYLPNVISTTSGANGTFRSCKSLTEISMDKLENISVVQMFNECTALKRVVFPKLYDTGYQAFERCTALEYFEFGGDVENASYPRAVSRLNKYFFNGCTSLSALVIRQSSAVMSLNSINAFANTPIESGTGYIYVPSALVEDYKVATNWATYADQIRAIEDYPEITGG